MPFDFTVRAFNPRFPANLPAEKAGIALPWAPLETELDLEIGCGAGWHPIRYARENPGRKLIAIEHTRNKFQNFQSRLAGHARLENLLPVHADAIRWVSQNVPPNSVDRCMIWYPNPEPKAPNKRWLRSPFMHRLLATLKPHGELHLATNIESYFVEALQWAEKAFTLEVTLQKSFTSCDAVQPRSHFEKKYLLRGDTCYEVHWRLPRNRGNPA